MEVKTKPISIEEVREKLSKAGPRWWRGVEEVMETPAFEKWVEDEFPERATLLQIDRRKFLKLTGAAMLMASLTGCRRLDKDKIVPFVKMPEDSVPGQAEYYASSFTLGGYATGILVESRQGRPTKIEGNPVHPASKGKTTAITQASIYGLYDPFRSQQAMNGRMSTTVDAFIKAASAELEKHKADGGAKVRILTETVTSPSLHGQIQKFLKLFPNAKWVVYESWNRDRVHQGTQLAFGEPLNPVYDLKKADVILSFDEDFLHRGPGTVRYSQDFASRRVVQNGDAASMSRLYMVETAPSITGATADHRMALKPSQISALIFEIAARVGVNVPAGNSGVDKRWIDAVANDLMAAKGRSLVMVGEHMGPQHIVHAINAALGNIGETVNFTDPVEYSGTPVDGSASPVIKLAEDIQTKQVEALFILGGNPAYTVTGTTFGDSIKKVPFSAHLSAYMDETSALTTWHVPETHFLEAWGDARAYDGTLTIQQPLIAPLYQTVTASELLEGLCGGARKSREILEDTWLGDPGVAVHWRQHIHDGMIRGSEFPFKSVTIRTDWGAIAPAEPSKGYEVVVLPDPTIYDGRFAGCPWLQELPKPMSSMVWDNAVFISPRTMQRIGIADKEKIRVATGPQAIEGICRHSFGQADDLIVMHLGYGRESFSPLAQFDHLDLRGFDATPFLRSRTGAASALTLQRVDGVQRVAETQEHHVMSTTGGAFALDLVRSGPASELEHNPNFSPNPHHDEHPLESLYNDEEFKYDGHKWAMTIDLNLCTGCGACVQACAVENNTPSVGKDQVIVGREMHWIRLDRYYKGGLDNPSEIVFQPVTCQQCENAPCEPVCPVAATTHSHEGLNQMVYNRCVGTRYCSNNCPYKVRRFNYLNFADKKDHPTLTLLNNPNVTVRGRGVMEKCTYCVQRINAARIDEKKSGKPLKDGDIVTACQQACPSNAIVFGDISDTGSAVSRWRADSRSYTLLKELNTRPRTTYLAKVRNTNPAVTAIEGAHGA